MSIYKSLKKKKNGPAKKAPKKQKVVPVINYNYVDGCFVELLNWPEARYLIKFINADTKQVLHQDEISTNSWAKCYFKYYINWRIEISTVEGGLLKTIDMDLKDKRVLIGVESKALGDTLAWMPYADEFRKKHGCKVVLCTFMNDLFKETYPEIEFIEPGIGVANLAAKYDIGWFYKPDSASIDLYRNPKDPKSQPMQKTSSDILGLPFKEVRPKLSLPKVKKTDTVTIGIHSTAQAKYWNNPKGWSDVVKYINSTGNTPLLLSREEDGHRGNKHPKGLTQLPAGPIQGVIEALCKSKLYIGVGSGLTWLAWACKVPVILISGFSEPYSEMQPQKNYVRIGAPKRKNLTSGCFNKYRFDISDWNWYEPAEFRGTKREFECSKAISSKTVIDAIKQFI